MRRLKSLPILAVIAIAALPASAGAAVNRTVIDGPSADIHSNQRDLAVAPDGTAAVTYLKKEGGKDRVFVSTWDGAIWSAPQRVDSGVSPPDNDSVLPDIGVGNGGKVVVAFRNNTRVYSAIRPAAGQPFALVPIVDPSYQVFKALVVDMNPAGVAYAAYVDFADDLRASRLEGTTWTPVGAAHPDPNGRLGNDPDNQDVNPDGGGLAVAAGG